VLVGETDLTNEDIANLKSLNFDETGAVCQINEN
jgi:hypothetical protein